MLGAIIGDMVGSMFESNPIKSKDFDIFSYNTNMTDDSLLTLRVASVLLKHSPIKYDSESLKTIQDDLIKEFVDCYENNKTAGFGMMFIEWCNAIKNHTKPFNNSYGNGSAMRISPVGWIAKNENEVKLLSKTVSEITHNHEEGLKGAEAIALCIYLTLHGSSKEQIRERMIKDYYPEIATLNFDDLVKNYTFNPTCQQTVPQAIYCFLISTSLEDAIRNCIAIGGDCDTTAAMAGAIAEAYYQKDQLSDFEDKFLYFMIDKKTEDIIKKFYEKYGNNKIK